MIIKTYSLLAKKGDPLISLRLPNNIWKDINLRAEENGVSVEIEIARRLMRTLERDLQMLDEDNEIAYTAFKTLEAIKKDKKIKKGGKNV